MESDENKHTGTTSFDRFDGYVFRDDRGLPRFTIGLVVLLYYFDGKTPEKMAARLQILEDYLDTFPGVVNMFVPLMSKRRKGTRDEILAYFSGLAADPRRKLTTMSAGYDRRGREAGEPQPYYVQITAGPVEAQLSQVVAYIPAGWLDTAGGDALVALVRRWASWIGAAHGTAGLGLQFNQAVGSQAADTMFPYLKRYPGLELGDRSSWLLEVKPLADQRFIRATNWLTLVDDGFVAALGGRRALEGALDPTCRLHAYEGGLVVQAGTRPETGDVNYGEIPGAYRSVARALKPIRYEAFSRFGLFDVPYGSGLLDQFEESLAWVRRFD